VTAVLLSQEFARSLQDLRSKASGGDGEVEYLLEIIDRGIRKLESNQCCGQQVRRRLFPEHYVSKYDVNNLWRLRLDSRRRLIYTLIGDRVQVSCVVLEVLNHKDYDRRFGYR
jgi:hypothetical protein